MPEILGPPQIAALLVLLQRGLEEVYSQRNTRRLIADGAHEVGRDYFPVVAASQLGWIAAVFFLIPPLVEVAWPLAIVYLLIQVVRYWIIATLGPYWTHRIITLDRAPMVRSGPYRFTHHPNYAVIVVETLLLPMIFGAWALALIMGAISFTVLRYKIVLEDAANATRRTA